MASGFQHVAPAVGADDGLDDGVVDARGGWDPWSGAGRCHHLFASTLAAQRDGDVDGYGATVLAQGGTAKLTGVHGRGAAHAASCWEPPLVRSSLQTDVSPSIRRRSSMPSGCRSTRSTSNSTMRACSAGNSSFQIGSNSRRAPRTSLSARVLSVLRAARQVWTMISGVCSSDRICSMTIRSISAAGICLTGQALAPCFITLWLM